jgi:hypothetical protein
MIVRTDFATLAASTLIAIGTAEIAAIVLRRVNRVLVVGTLLGGATVCATSCVLPPSAAGMAGTAAIVHTIALRLRATNHHGAMVLAPLPASLRNATGTAAIAVIVLRAAP